MSFELTQKCIDYDLPEMEPSEWRVFLVICRHADDEKGDNCHPGMDLICKKSRLSKNIVRKAIQRLEADGWIRTSQAPGDTRYFFVNVGKVNSCMPFSTKKEQPRAEVNPLQKVVGDPSQKCTPTPPRSEPLRNQEETKEETNTSMASAQVKVETATGSEVPQLALLPDAPEATTSARADAIPYSRIVEIYNRELGNALGMCQRLSPQRKACIRQRWSDIAEIVESKLPEDVLEGFQAYYRKVSRSDFLMGRTDNSSFKATFDWIHKQSNFIKIFEDNYANYRRQKVQRTNSAYHHIPI